MTDKIAEIRARHENDFISDIRKRHEHDKMITESMYFPEHYWERAPVGQRAHLDRAALLAEVERLIRERDEARAEVERLRAEKEALYASIVGIERAAAGAIYSQESIHAMALYALKSLEVKP
jgi:hypothetical protein